MMTSTGARVSTSALPALSDPSDGVTFTMLGASIRLIARATDSEGRFTVFEQTTPPGWGPPRHVHANEDEIVYVLDGTYEMSLGDERRTVSAGGCAILPRGIPHGFRNAVRCQGASCASSLPVAWRSTSWRLPDAHRPRVRRSWSAWQRAYGLTLLPPGA